MKSWEKLEAPPQGVARSGRNHCLECGGRSPLSGLVHVLRFGLVAPPPLARPPPCMVWPGVAGHASGARPAAGLGGPFYRCCGSALERRGQLGRCWAQSSSPGSSWPRLSPAPRHSKCRRWVSFSRGADGGAGAGGRPAQLWRGGWGLETPARRLHLPGTWELRFGPGERECKPAL